MSINMDTDRLTRLLEEAQAAHHEYEQSLDEPDENWARWYAEYVVARVEGATDADE